MSSAIHFASNGDIQIAYKVVGSGPPDLIFIQGHITNLDIYWDDRAYREFCERLASFSRLILFDKRGMGLSDRVETGTMEDRMDDVRAVLDAVGSRAGGGHGRLRGRTAGHALRSGAPGARRIARVARG